MWPDRISSQRPLALESGTETNVHIFRHRNKLYQQNVFRYSTGIFYACWYQVTVHVLLDIMAVYFLFICLCGSLFIYLFVSHFFSVSFLQRIRLYVMCFSNKLSVRIT